MTRSSWDERFDRWGQTIGARYRLWMVGTSLLACGLMSVSLAIAPFVMLLPEFSPTGSVLAAREMGRIQAVHGVASQSDAVQTQQQYVVENFCVIFRHREGGSLLDRDVISRMKQMEDMVLNHAGYADLCKHAAGVSPPVCQPPASIVNIAYASKRSLGGDALITVLDREGELAADPATDIFRAMVEGSEWLDQLLANNDGCRRPPHHCAYSRTLFLLAGPLAGFSNLQERKSEQAAIFLSFLEQISRDVLLPLAANASEPLQISFTGDELWRYELNVYIYRDAMMTTGSFALLFSCARRAAPRRCCRVAAASAGRRAVAWPLAWRCAERAARRGWIATPRYPDPLRTRGCRAAPTERAKLALWFGASRRARAEPSHATSALARRPAATSCCTRARWSSRRSRSSPSCSPSPRPTSFTAPSSGAARAGLLGGGGLFSFSAATAPLRPSLTETRSLLRTPAARRGGAGATSTGSR